MTVRNNIFHFHQPVKMPGGYAFDHVKTLEMIDRYYNSRFETGNFDKKKRRKFFYNIVKPACDIASKFVDLDTKDILLISEKSDIEWKIWLMQRDLKHWMKKEKIATLFNDIAMDYPRYGHVVVKKSKGGALNLLSLHNIRTDTTVEWLKDSSWVYEVHRMTKDQIEEMGWNQKDAIAKLFERGEEDEYIVYECYHKKGKGYQRYIKADLFTTLSPEGTYKRSVETRLSESDEYVPELTLHEDKVTELPYRELKWESERGRWLGRGYVEYLEENQIAENEAENLERIGLYLKALMMWWTRDESIGRNVFTDMDPGDIIHTNTDFNLVQKDNSDLAAFNATRGRWTTNAERKTFSFDVARGENLPSQTPLGLGQLQAGMVTSYFDLKRENFGIFIKELLLNDIIPTFKQKSMKEHLLTVVGGDEELEMYRKFVVDSHLDQKIDEYVENTGFAPATEQVEQERQRLIQQVSSTKNQDVTVPEFFYDNAEFDVDIITTGEQLDTGARTQSLQTFLQLVFGNPQALQDPVARKAILKSLELVGISAIDLGAIEQAAKQNQMPPEMLAMMQQGGSVASPQQSQQPVRMPAQMQI